MTLYDKHPVYPHHEDLFWAHEPYKTIYVLQRILTTVLLVPCWVIYYGILPRKFRPRPSWSIKQIVVVKFMKRVGKVVERAGVTWGTRDPTQAPDENKLKETRFVWAPPLPDDLRTGIVDDEIVPCKPVGMYVWPKELPPAVRARKSSEKRDLSSSTDSDYSNATAVDGNSDPESDAADAPPRVIGIYLHGGGYCHYSAHESAGTSRVPRRLVKDGLFQEIYAVEYRLLQHAPVPGAIQDAAAAYAHVVTNELGAKRGEDGRYYFPDPSNTAPKAEDGVFNLPPGSLTRAEAHAAETGERPDPVPLPRPHSDGAQDDSVQPVLSGTDAIPSPPFSGAANIPQINISSPSSPGVPTPRLPSQPFAMPQSATASSFAARTPISSRFADSPALTPEITPYPTWRLPRGRARTKIVLIGDSAGGNLVLALARWIRDEALLPPPDGMLLLSPSCDPSHTLPQVPASRRPRPHEATDYLLDTPEPRALLQRTFLGHHPPEFVYSPYISPSSEWVLSVFHGANGMQDLETLHDIQQGKDTREWREGPGELAACNGEGASRPAGPGRTASTNPYIRDPSGQGLFTNFPRALIVLGDAERLEREVLALERGLERDNVRVRMVWAKDGCHDLLILAYWDEKVREGIWREIGKWVREVDAEA